MGSSSMSIKKVDQKTQSVGKSKKSAGSRSSVAPLLRGSNVSDKVLQLQSLVGNRAVSHMVRKGMFGSPVQPKSAGKRMPGDVSKKMESSFGEDLSDVRVHEGPEASLMGAQAYTQKNNLFFARGRYAPRSQPGQDLLGHELAHVIQQRQGRVPKPRDKGNLVVINPSLETEADRSGARAARGFPAAGNLSVQLKSSRSTVREDMGIRGSRTIGTRLQDNDSAPIQGWRWFGWFRKKKETGEKNPEKPEILNQIPESQPITQGPKTGESAVGVGKKEGVEEPAQVPEEVEKLSGEKNEAEKDVAEKEKEKIALEKEKEKSTEEIVSTDEERSGDQPEKMIPAQNEEEQFNDFSQKAEEAVEHHKSMTMEEAEYEKSASKSKLNTALNVASKLADPVETAVNYVGSKFKKKEVNLKEYIPPSGKRGIFSKILLGLSITVGIAAFVTACVFTGGAAAIIIPAVAAGLGGIITGLKAKADGKSNRTALIEGVCGAVTAGVSGFLGAIGKVVKGATGAVKGALTAAEWTGKACSAMGKTGTGSSVAEDMVYHKDEEEAIKKAEVADKVVDKKLQLIRDISNQGETLKTKKVRANLVTKLIAKLKKAEEWLAKQKEKLKKSIAEMKEKLSKKLSETKGSYVKTFFKKIWGGIKKVGSVVLKVVTSPFTFLNWVGKKTYDAIKKKKEEAIKEKVEETAPSKGDSNPEAVPVT